MADIATVTIAGETRDLSAVEESWVTQQINRRLRDGLTVCVVVRVCTALIDVNLATAGCTGGLGGGRSPNHNEQAVIDLWRSQQLHTAAFTGGNLVAFLKQLRRYL